MDMPLIKTRQGRCVEIAKDLNGAVRINVHGSLDFAAMTPEEVYKLMVVLGQQIGIELQLLPFTSDGKIVQ